jgi:hypothetical protein
MEEGAVNPKHSLTLKMKPFFAILLALLLGIGLGTAIGWLRYASTPWVGLPVVESEGGPATHSQTGAPAPKVSVDRLEYDFGTLDVENKGRQEFIVTNRGNALLKLTKGDTTCRCTASDLDKSELPPGESTQIVLTFRPADEPGPYKQSATFYTNDPTRPEFTLTITGKITATLRLKPAVLTLSRISGHESTSGTVTILNYLDQPLELSNPRFEENANRQYFDATFTPLSDGELKEHPEAKSGFLLTVLIKPGLPQGAFKQTITLTTNNPNKKELPIPIEGSVGEEISVAGAGWDSAHGELYLGMVKSSEGLSRRLLLVVHGPYRREVQFKLLEPVPVPLKITLGKMTEINAGQVTQTPLLIEIPKGSPQASYMGHVHENGEDLPDEAAIIQLETTHPDASKIRIPVRFAVEK